jgi:hypothetical protein
LIANTFSYLFEVGSCTFLVKIAALLDTKTYTMGKNVLDSSVSTAMETGSKKVFSNHLQYDEAGLFVRPSVRHVRHVQMSGRYGSTPC